jgi:L-2-hydroxyglutarate oxidase LhgO
MLTRAEVERREPAVRAVAGLLSPETGILDAHGWMDALARRAGAAGADLVPGAAVGRLAPDGGGWTVGFRDSGGEGELRARAVINAAGLGAQETMRLAGLDPEAMGLALHPCKGEYFSVGGALRRAVRGLVYPSPEADLRGLGIHTVVDLGGGLKLGPNALYAEADDLRVDPAHAEAFHREASRYLPSLRAEDLAPAMSGIRPKLAGPGEPARDFHIAHEDAAGAPGFVNLCGIESPGLTASPALGEAVASLVDAILA